MFFAAHADGSYSPLELSGVSGSTEVKSLQASLTRLANVLRRPEALPGPTNGTIGERTMISIAGLLDKISPNLPMWVVHPLQSSMTLGVSSTEAKNTVGRYVTEIRYAADQASNLWGQLPDPPHFDPDSNSLSGPIADFFAPGWYTMPSRLMILGGVVLLGFFGVWLWRHH